MNIADLELFHEREIINHVNSLMFEREAGTIGENKTINYIKKVLTKEHIEYYIDTFKWAKTITILVNLLTFFLISSTVLFELLFHLNLDWLIITFDLILIVIVIILLNDLIDMTYVLLIGRRKKSKNLIAKIPAKDKKPKTPLIIFSAHYDSKSENFSYSLKRFFFLVEGTLFFPFTSFTLVLSVWSILTNFSDLYINDFYSMLSDQIIRFSYVSFGFLMISILILLLNRDPSKSLGSIDNASGISILIELAILLNKSPLEHIDVMFLWCGAEEWGLWGSKRFCIKHFNDLNQEYNLDESYNINIDMVGSDIALLNKTGFLKKNNYNNNIINVLEATANSLKIPLRKFDVTIEPRSDHISFRSFAKKAQKSMEACCFLSSKDIKFIHSSRDTPNKCIPNNLKGCVDICYNAIKSIDLRKEQRR
ncbi:MAG: M28 family metallopeptidase [Candidatus Thorarchaeota archaeon]